MTWNSQSGFRTRRPLDYLGHWTASSRSMTSQRIQYALSQWQDLDFIGLQELDKGSWRTNFVSQIEALKGHQAFPYQVFRTSRKIGKLATSGLGLVSKYPILWAESHALPGRLRGRRALHAQVWVEPAQTALNLWLVHMSLGVQDQERQLQWLLEAVYKYSHGQPWAVLGDLNTGPHHHHFKSWTRQLGLAESLDGSALPLTYPRWNPKRSLDHVVSPWLYAPPQVWPGYCGESDHLPVVATLELKRKTNEYRQADLA